MYRKLSVVYEGDRVLGEVELNQQGGVVFDVKEIRITQYSPPSERCPPLAVLHTINPNGICFKMESTAKNLPDSPLSVLHATCLRDNKTAVASIGGGEIQLVAMHSRKYEGQACFWGFNVASSLYNSCLVMLNLRCLGIVFDLDETLIVAKTMRSFENGIDALKRKLNSESDSQRVSGMLAEVKRYQDDKLILKQYAENDQVVDNGKVIKSQSEVVLALSDNHQTIVRPIIRLPDKNIILTRINPQIRDTSVLVRLRPAWEELRSYLTARGRKRFEVFVCTMAERDYALEMWRLLDPESNLIESRELLDRIVCVKSGSKKSLFNVFQGGNCHPKMALVIDDRLKVWDEKDQPRVHVVPAFAPYYAPQAEANNTVPAVLCVARNVACNIRGGFFKEFDDGLLQRISGVAYEDGLNEVPFPPDVSNFLVSEEDPSTSNGNKDSIGFDGMADVEVDRRLKSGSAEESKSSPGGDSPTHCATSGSFMEDKQIVILGRHPEPNRELSPESSEAHEDETSSAVPDLDDPNADAPTDFPTASRKRKMASTKKAKVPTVATNCIRYAPVVEEEVEAIIASTGSGAPHVTTIRTFSDQYRPWVPVSDITRSCFVREQIEKSPPIEDPMGDFIYHLEDVICVTPHRSVKDRLTGVSPSGQYHYTLTLLPEASSKKLAKKTITPANYKVLPDVIQSVMSTWGVEEQAAYCREMEQYLPEGWRVEVPGPHERPSDPYDGCCIVFQDTLVHGLLRFPLHPLLVELFTVFQLVPSQLGYNSYTFIAGFIAEMVSMRKEPTLRRLLQIYQLQTANNSYGVHHIQTRAGFAFLGVTTERKKWEEKWFKVFPSESDTLNGRGLSFLNRQWVIGRRELSRVHDPFPPLTSAELALIVATPWHSERLLRSHEYILRLIGWTVKPRLLPVEADVGKHLHRLVTPDTAVERSTILTAIRSIIMPSSGDSRPNSSSASSTSPSGLVSAELLAQIEHLKNENLRLSEARSISARGCTDAEHKALRLQGVRDFAASDTAQVVIRKITSDYRRFTFFKGLYQLQHQMLLSEKDVDYYSSRIHIGYDAYCRPLPDIVLDSSKDEFVALVDEDLPKFRNSDALAYEDPPEVTPLPYGEPAIVFGEEFVPERRKHKSSRSRRNDETNREE